MEPPFGAIHVYAAQMHGAVHTGAPLSHTVQQLDTRYHSGRWDTAINTHNTNPILVERVFQALLPIVEETADKDVS